MKVYRLKPKENSRGLTKSSFVKDPAIDSTLLFFQNENTLKFINEERREIYAPLLIPNKEIFRRDVNGEPSKVLFTAEDIKELHLKGCKNGYDSKVNLNHEDMNVDGVYCFESWIIENPHKDKSTELGFNLPQGTLMKAYKVENEEVWGLVKNKELMGLSIEVLTEDLDFIELENKKQIKMKKNKKSILDYVKSLFNTELAKEYSSGMFAESLEEGAIVTDKDGNPAIDSEFEVEGKKYKTDSMGSIVSIETIEENKNPDKKAEGFTAEDVEALKAKIAELETENSDLKAEIGKSKSSVEKMQAQLLEGKKIMPKAIDKKYEDMSNYEKYLFNRGKL